MQLAVGTFSPDIQTQDFLGDVVDLQALRGRPVMLSFYRYASCPVCNLRMHALITAHQSLADQGLALVAVFQSPADSIRQYVGRQDAPFSIVPDPDMALYRRFGLESRWGGMFTWRVVRAVLQAFAKGFLPGRIEGPAQRMPADFLIDAQGRIAVAHYGRDIDDHLPLATIQQWLTSTPRR